jgi:Stage II sporulation protein E (SpoIIE)/Beta-galactosidase jelly roll domain
LPCMIPHMLSRLIGLLWVGPRWMLRVLLVLLALPVVVPAQSRVALGNATVELTGPWRFHTGDDPAWARPEFDDSAWSTLDLTAPRGSYDPYSGSSGFVAGWTTRGYPGYSGFAWYRLHVNLRDPVSGGLALKMPHNVDDAYQVYVNGEFIGEFGRFAGQSVTAYIAQPRAFTLAAGTDSGPLTIAVRMWMDPHTPLIENAAGGMHGPVVLGQAQVVMAMLRLDWDALDRSEFSELLVAAILLLAITVGFSLHVLDRTEFAYLWLGVTCIAVWLVICLRYMAYHSTWVPGAQVIFWRDAILLPAQMALWIFFWACWFRLDGMKRLRAAVWALVVLLALGTALERAPLYGHVLPVDELTWVPPFVLAIKLLLGAALLWVTYRGLLKDRTEGLLALPAVALIGVAQYQYEFQLFHAPILFFVYGYTVSASQIATVLSLAIITVLLLRRFIHAQRVREQWRLEIEQARQVQQVLIPEEIPSVPGFALEGEYRPSQQVGGDFFQIIPGPDGSILAIIGDVSGKGLRAAMLVSLIVGAVRTLARFTRDPVEVLRGVNERLCGHLKDQFATCLALHIAADGETTIANAGHLPPFLNGHELVMAGSIPLGIIESAPIEKSTLLLEPGDRFILLTDGIVEAQNKQRELFGFVRLGELALLDRSSVEIAVAAQEFGQQDDITVLRIQRIGIDAHSAVRSQKENEPLTRVLEYS